MLRYAVCYRTLDHKQRPSEVMYEAIGIGSSRDPQNAHLYTSLALAEKKATQHRKYPWYVDVEVIPVTVIGLQ
jgi:hypothetical protein